MRAISHGNEKRPRAAPTAGGMDTPEVTGMSVRKRRVRAPKRGTRLAVARGRAGLSQRQLAERLGVAKSTVARVELGQTTPSLELALGLAHVLGDSVEALFGGER
jgi:DNA-binding XRE family transcriptional regulator